MANIIKIIMINFKRIVKNPIPFLIWISFPFVLALLYWLAFGQHSSGKRLPKINILILDKDKSFVSRLLPMAFQSKQLEKFFKIENIEDQTTIIKSFENDRASAAIIIPNKFQSDLLSGNKTKLQIVKNPSQYFSPLVVEESLKIIINITNRYLENAKNILQSINQLKENETNEDQIAQISKEFYKLGRNLNFKNLNLLNVSVIIDKDKKRQTASNFEEEPFLIKFLPGLILFSMMFLTLELQQLIFRDKTSGIIKKISSSPIKIQTILIGQTTFLLLASIFYLIITFIITIAIIKIFPKNLLSFLLTAIGFSIFTVGLSKSIYSMARSERGAGAIATAIIVLLSLIGGSWIPLEFYPERLQLFAKISPIGMAAKSLIDSFINFNALSLTGIYILGLWAYSIVLIIVGTIYEIKQFNL